jgi:hypothetical protein
MRTVTLEEAVRDLPIERVHPCERDPHEELVRAEHRLGKIHHLRRSAKLQNGDRAHGAGTTRDVFKEPPLGRKPRLNDKYGWHRDPSLESNES